MWPDCCGLFHQRPAVISDGGGMRLAADLCVCIGAKGEKMIDKSSLVCYNK